MGTKDPVSCIKHPVPDRVKSECPDVKNNTNDDLTGLAQDAL